MENIKKLNIDNINKINEELIDYYIYEYKYGNKKDLQFYLLLIKYCIENNRKLFELISQFDFNMDINNKK